MSWVIYQRNYYSELWLTSAPHSWSIHVKFQVTCMCPEKPVPADIPSGKLGAICQDLVFPSLQSCWEGKHGELQKQIFELCTVTVFCEIFLKFTNQVVAKISLLNFVQQFYCDCGRCQCPENVSAFFKYQDISHFTNVLSFLSRYWYMWSSELPPFCIRKAKHLSKHTHQRGLGSWHNTSCASLFLLQTMIGLFSNHNGAASGELFCDYILWEFVGGTFEECSWIGDLETPHPPSVPNFPRTMWHRVRQWWSRGQGTMGQMIRYCCNFQYSNKWYGIAAISNIQINDTVLLQFPIFK